MLIHPLAQRVYRFKPATLAVTLVVGLFFAAFFLPASATDYSNTGFILRDPVITIEGGYSSSTAFQFFSSTGQTDIGESSAAAFIQRAGFLYFPDITAPVVSATAGDSQVSLSWTAASSETGYSPAAYEVAQATIAGGPYAYSNVGAVLASTRTSLTNGTTYYFVVRALDSLGDAFASSTEVSSTPVAAAVTPSPGGGGGGNFFPPPSQNTASVEFTGKAFVSGPVILLRDGQIVAITAADSAANFTLTSTNLAPGDYVFTLYGVDADGRRSKSLTFQVSVALNAATAIAGIMLPPTLASDNFQVIQGEPLTLFGYSAPQALISLVIDSSRGSESPQVTADTAGRYEYLYRTVGKNIGDYFARSKAELGTFASIFNDPMLFKIGTTTIPVPPIILPPVEPPVIPPVEPLPPVLPGACPIRGDLNGDCRVDIVDFSILIYWFDHPGWPAKIDLNSDGRVNIVDFSIMAYYWTG